MRFFIAISMLAMIVGCKQKQSDSGTSSYSQKEKQKQVNSIQNQPQNNQPQNNQSQISNYRQLNYSESLIYRKGKELTAQSDMSLYGSKYPVNEPIKCENNYIAKGKKFTIDKIIGETDESEYYKIQKEDNCNIIKVSKNVENQIQN